VRREDYDLVHAFFGFPTGWLCYRTAGKLPYIISLRGSDVPGANARLKLEYKLLGSLVFTPIWRRAAALVACSEGLKSRALKFLPSAGIQVIPNGVDLERFRPADTKPSRGTGGDRPTALRLLTVGRLSTTKRVPLLVEAVESLRRQGRAAQLTIVGGGALKTDIERLVAQRGLSDIVRVVGRVESEQMPEIYRGHDVFVSASMQEGMSNAMLEAMASGLPIVTTRCEGVDELIADNGIVVDAAEPGPLAEAVRAVADDTRAWSAMSIAARRRAERFAWSRTAQQYVNLYQECCRGAGG
jgi:glycosyltransferase involved in cell wall biosynthesis